MIFGSRRKFVSQMDNVFDRILNLAKLAHCMREMHRKIVVEEISHATSRS